MVGAVAAVVDLLNMYPRRTKPLGGYSNLRRLAMHRFGVPVFEQYTAFGSPSNLSRWYYIGFVFGAARATEEYQPLLC